MSVSRFLDIYDASGFIYTGYMSGGYSRGGRDVIEGYPVTGVRYLLKSICSSLAQRRDIVLCFDSKLDGNKYTNTDYKAGRPKIHAVYSQMDFAYTMLSDCGVICLKAPRQEADNLIYNTVEENKDKYDIIRIFTTDYDIAHNVMSNVTMYGANSKTNIVTKDNFHSSIVPGEYIHWNSISAYKVFNGDKSDNIKPFTSEQGVSGHELYPDFIKVISSILNAQQGTDTEDHIEFRSPDLLKGYLGTQKHRLTDNDIKKLNSRINLVFPEKNNLFDYSLVSNVTNVNMDKFLDLIIMLQDRSSYQTLVRQPLVIRSLNENEIKIFQKYSKGLSSGSFAVDNTLSFSTQFSDTSSVNIKGI